MRLSKLVATVMTAAIVTLVGSTTCLGVNNADTPVPGSSGTPSSNAIGSGLSGEVAGAVYAFQIATIPSNGASLDEAIYNAHYTETVQAMLDQGAYSGLVIDNPFNPAKGVSKFRVSGSAKACDITGKIIVTYSGRSSITFPTAAYNALVAKGSAIQRSDSKNYSGIEEVKTSFREAAVEPATFDNAVKEFISGGGSRDTSITYLLLLEAVDDMSGGAYNSLIDSYMKHWNQSSSDQYVVIQGESANYICSEDPSEWKKGIAFTYQNWLAEKVFFQTSASSFKTYPMHAADYRSDSSSYQQSDSSMWSSKYSRQVRYTTNSGDVSSVAKQTAIYLRYIPAGFGLSGYFDAISNYNYFYSYMPTGIDGTLKGAPGYTFVANLESYASNTAKSKVGQMFISATPKGAVAAKGDSVKADLSIDFKCESAKDSALINADAKAKGYLQIDSTVSSMGSGGVTVSPNVFDSVSLNGSQAAGLTYTASGNTMQVRISPYNAVTVANILNGTTKFKVIDNGITVNASGSVTYKLNSNVKLQSNTSSMTSRGVGGIGTAVASDIASWVVDLATPHYYSSPRPAYAEIKADTPNNESFEAMAGVPTTHDLYVGTGSTDFMLNIELEWHEQSATRTFTLVYTAAGSDHGDDEKDHRYKTGPYDHGNASGTWIDGSGSGVTRNINRANKGTSTMTFVATQEIDNFSYMDITNAEMWMLSDVEMLGNASLMSPSNFHLDPSLGYRAFINQGAYSSGNGRLVFSYALPDNAFYGNTGSSKVGSAGKIHSSHEADAIAWANSILGNKTMYVTCFSDFITLTTREGYQVPMYYAYSSNAILTPATLFTSQGVTSCQNQTFTTTLPKLTWASKPTQEQMWDNNADCSSKWDAEHITRSGYNGDYSNPSTKWNNSNATSSTNITDGLFRAPFTTHPNTYVLDGSTDFAKNWQQQRLTKTGLNIIDSTTFSSSGDAAWSATDGVSPVNNGEWDTGHLYMNWQKVVDLNDTSGYEWGTELRLDIPYSSKHSKINNIVIHNPVSTEKAVIVCNDEKYDHRVYPEISNGGDPVKLPETCPGDGLCQFSKFTCTTPITEHLPSCYNKVWTGKHHVGGLNACSGGSSSGTELSAYLLTTDTTPYGSYHSWTSFEHTGTVTFENAGMYRIFFCRNSNQYGTSSFLVTRAGKYNWKCSSTMASGNSSSNWYFKIDGLGDGSVAGWTYFAGGHTGNWANTSQWNIPASTNANETYVIVTSGLIDEDSPLIKEAYAAGIKSNPSLKSPILDYKRYGGNGSTPEAFGLGTHSVNLDKGVYLIKMIGGSGGRTSRMSGTSGGVLSFWLDVSTSGTYTFAIPWEPGQATYGVGGSPTYIIAPNGQILAAAGGGGGGSKKKITISASGGRDIRQSQDMSLANGSAGSYSSTGVGGYNLYSTDVTVLDSYAQNYDKADSFASIQLYRLSEAASKYSALGSPTTYTSSTNLALNRGVYYVRCVGAKGGDARGSSGSYGRITEGFIQIKENVVTYINVGAVGATGNDVGYGGGYSYIKLPNLPSVLLSAAGGGGGAKYSNSNAWYEIGNTDMFGLARSGIGGYYDWSGDDSSSTGYTPLNAFELGKTFFVKNLGICSASDVPSVTVWPCNDSTLIPMGEVVDPVFDIHVCTSACYDEYEMVPTCGNPHHVLPGQPKPAVGSAEYSNPKYHYAFPDARCYTACHDDNKHKTSEDVVNDSILGINYKTTDVFINLDREFKLYFPNEGDFAQTPNMLGISECTDVRGKGYTDGMDTTDWTRSKFVTFPFNVIGTLKGSGTASSRENMYQAFTPIDLLSLESESNNKKYYTFYCVLGNNELNNCIVHFDAIASNAMEVSYYNESNGVTNALRTKSGEQARHTASRTRYIDVVGYLGALAINDTGDFRYSELFKQATGDWLITNVIHKVELSRPNKIMADNKDVRYETAGVSTNWHDAYGLLYQSTGGHAWQHISLPLVPYKNNVNALVKEPMRVGYPIMFDVETVGNYQVGSLDGNNNWLDNNMYNKIQIVPRYYSLNLSDGAYDEVDVYKHNSTGYTPVYLFDRPNSSDVSQFYQYLNWGDESARRNFTSKESQNSKNVQSDFTVERNATLVDGSTDVCKIIPRLPQIDPEIEGHVGLLNLNDLDRTFIGSCYTYGVSKNINGLDGTKKIADTEFSNQAQRHHFTLQLPSSSVFVKKNMQCTDDNISEIATNNRVIVCTLEIVAIGDTWCLGYDGSSINYSDGSGFKVVPGGRTYTPPIRYADVRDCNGVTTNKQVEDIVVSVFHPYKTAADDLKVEGFN